MWCGLGLGCLSCSGRTCGAKRGAGETAGEIEASIQYVGGGRDSHPHNRTWEQLARGLYGALVAEEADGGPEVDRDELLLIDDWRLTPEAQIDQRFGAMGDRSHGGRLGNWVTINGVSDWRREVRRHERFRLRLANAANARILELELHGLEGWVVALDG